MYTKCPDCQTDFRVTAGVLKQARGRVRCGGCGRAFNALERLSEKPPPAPQTVQPQPPAEEPLAERNKALLETLDNLAGSEEVRIEDTGIEWRVLDDDDDETPGNNTDPDATGSARRLIEDDDEAAGKQDANIPEISDTINATDSSNPDEMRFDDNTPLPDDFVDSDDEAYTLPAVPRRRADDLHRKQRSEFEELQADLALGEPDDWMDLLDEVDDSTAGGRGIPLEVEEELAAIHSELSNGETPAAIDPEETVDLPIMPPKPPDLDSQFELQAEAMGLDLQEEETAAAPVEAEVDAGPQDDAEAQKSRAELESTGDFEQQIGVAREALARQFDIVGESEAAEEDTGQPDGEPVEELELADTGEDSDADDGDESLPELPPDSPPKTPTRDSDHIVPPQTEAEKTVNEQIDQELLAAAASAKDFAATVAENPQALFDEQSPDVETIIMEGESVRASFEMEQPAAEKDDSAQLEELGLLADTYAMNRDKVRGGRRRTDPPGFGLIASAALLTLLLLAQFMHASRQSLSTYGAFNQTLGPVYRILGQPVTPQWDVTGWQFQTTNGATDDNEEVLTIFSRIVNRSGQPLPYPLVHVSLTDRWEEIIGSRILEPNEYLAGDLDPSRPVAAADSFSAVITIEDPSADATGFKLNVCYRISPGRVRCATEDFKDQ